MKTPLLASKGEGDIMLDSGQMNFRLKTTILPNLKRGSHGGFADLRGITIPMQIYGPYATPTITLDLGAASGGNLDKLNKEKTAKTTTPASVTPKTKVKTKQSK